MKFFWLKCNRPIAAWAGVMICALALSACNLRFHNPSYTPSSEPKDDDPRGDYWSRPRDVPVGSVTFIEAGRFLLLDNPKNLALAVGQKLYVEGQGGRSILRVTAERTNTHLTADIASGNPHVGDPVIYRHRPGEMPAVGSDGQPIDQISDAPTEIEATPLDLENPLPPLR